MRVTNLFSNYPSTDMLLGWWVRLLLVWWTISMSLQQETGSTTASLAGCNLHFGHVFTAARSLCPFDNCFLGTPNRPAPRLLPGCGRACCPVCFVWRQKNKSKKKKTLWATNGFPLLFADHATSHLSGSSDQRADRALRIPWQALCAAVYYRALLANNEALLKSALKGFIVRLIKNQSKGMVSCLCITETPNYIGLNQWRLGGSCFIPFVDARNVSS